MLLTARIAHCDSHEMPRQSKRLQSNAGAPPVENHVSKKSKTQSNKEAFTSLQCFNITNKSIFVEGLQKAGLEVVLLPFSGGDDPDQAIVVVRSQVDARQIVNALHGSPMEGRAMHVSIIELGAQKGTQARLPKVKYIRQCVSDAFFKIALKEGFAREDPEHAVDTQQARTQTEVPEVAIKMEEVDDDLVMEKREKQARELLDSRGLNSGGLGEQICKQENAEEPDEMRHDSFRPEPSAMQQIRAGETQSDIRGESCQIQDTARVITPTRSPTPEDFLSALLAYLDEGMDAVVNKPRAPTRLTT